MNNNSSLKWLAVVVFSVVAVPWAANAVVIPDTGTITFSGELSDNDAPIEYFNATYEYSYDPGSCLFTLTVYNETAAPHAYTVSEVFFNVSDDVLGLTLVDNGGFSGATLSQYRNADGFGTFDYKLDLGSGNTGLAAGGVATFVFEVCSESCDLTLADFFSGLSWGGGRTPAEAAIKFTQGPCGDSVYAIPGQPQVVPEPATNMLLGLGIVGLIMRRFRKSQ